MKFKLLALLFLLTSFVVKAGQEQREYIIFDDPVLVTLEENLAQYIPRVVLLAFEKWKFMMTLIEGVSFCSRLDELAKSIPVSLKIMAQAEKNGVVLDSATKERYAQSLKIIKDIINTHKISIKEAIKAKKIPKRLVTCWCAQKGISNSIIQEWGDAFPNFSEEEKLKNYTALELYDLLFNLRELYRDIVMNLQKTHETFKAYYFVNNKSYANANKDLFKLLVNGHEWSVERL